MQPPPAPPRKKTVPIILILIFILILLSVLFVVYKRGEDFTLQPSLTYSVSGVIEKIGDNNLTIKSNDSMQKNYIVAINSNTKIVTALNPTDTTAKQTSLSAKDLKVGENIIIETQSTLKEDTLNIKAAVIRIVIENILTGVITDISDSYISIDTPVTGPPAVPRKMQNYRILVNQDTAIVFEGKKSNFSDLKKGILVTIYTTFDTNSGNLNATKIEVPVDITAP